MMISAFNVVTGAWNYQNIKNNPEKYQKLSLLLNSMIGKR